MGGAVFDGQGDGDDFKGELLVIIKMVVVMVTMEMVIMLILNKAMLTIATAFITLM